MTPNQKLLAAQFLEQMSDEYGSHSCNDYELPNTPENLAMMEAYHVWNTHDDPAQRDDKPFMIRGDSILTYDFIVIGYLAYLLKQETEII